MAKCDVYPTEEFASWQVWPGSYGNPLSPERYPFPECETLTLHLETPIVTIGSCFAREVKNGLLASGYNVLQAETEHRISRHASAAWERTYNTFCLRQIFEYSFEEWNPGLRWWITPETSRVQDPYRRNVVYDNLVEAERIFAEHRVSSRRVLEEAKVLVIALESTEIWEDTTDGQVIALPSGPYPGEGGDMSRYRFRVSRFGENLTNLEKIRSLLARHNPGCAIMLMVSPVHQWATHRADADVITAGGCTKATLRTVADELVARYDNVRYFPALEIATAWQALHGRSIFAEGRENFHINPETLDAIMHQFILRHGSR